MQKIKEKTGLVWFGNDLRVHDNDVLSKASHENDKVIGVYCIHPKLLEFSHFGFRKLESFRAYFLLDSLQNLKTRLKELNITLLVYTVAPEDIIPDLCKIYDIDTIYKQKEWTSEETKELQSVQEKVSTTEVKEIYNQFLYHPEDILSNPQKIPNVFSTFRKKLEKYIEIRAESNTVKKFEKDNLVKQKNLVPSLSELGLDTIQGDQRTAFPFSGGEDNALERLQYYFFETKKLGFYKKTRNGLEGKDYSSKFSPWLANGSLSPRTIYWNVKKFEQEHVKNQSTYWLIFELIWRDYFKYVSLKYKNDIFKIRGILQKDYQWNSNHKLIQQWIHGETPDDFVNANMIELKETGWMSNRGRQNVASYFSKELKLDWRIGAAYFEAMLLDYDVHSNYGNWMYVSGVGNDPRDRKFNTQLQAERYDSNHSFRKLWLQKTLF